MNQELLERLELKLAYLERANHDLSDVVYRQQRELDELRARLVAFTNRMNELVTHQRPFTEDEERPPHY
jgi:SlyX protein